MQVGSGAAMDDSTAVSPPPPALPPRRYRGEMDLTAVDRLPSVVTPSPNCMDSTNGESTLPHNTYANQLRRQARRYQQSRGSSFSHYRPPPDWKPPPPPILPQEPPSSSDPTFTCKSSESDRRKSRAEVAFPSGHTNESDVHKTRIELTASSGSRMTVPELHKSWEHTSFSAAETPNAATISLVSGNKVYEVQNSTANVSNSPRESSFSSENSSTVISGHPAVDVVSGYDRYYSVGSSDHSPSLSRSFSVGVPLDSESTKTSCIRRSSQPAVQLSARLKVPLRGGTQSTETSPRNAVESSAVERSTSFPSIFVGGDSTSTVDHTVETTASAGLPGGKLHLNTSGEVEEKTTPTPSPKDLEASGSVDGVSQEVIEPRLTEPTFFQRQKFPMEMDCARQAEIVAGMLRRMDRDESLSSILVPSAGHRSAIDFMAKVLGLSESDPDSCDDLPEPLRQRISSRATRHAAL